MKPCGQYTQDLDRVVGINLMYRLSAHTPAGYQGNPCRQLKLKASARSPQMIIAASGYGRPRHRWWSAKAKGPRAKVGANMHRHGAVSGYV